MMLGGHPHMPSYFFKTFTEYPYLVLFPNKVDSVLCFEKFPTFLVLLCIK